MVLETLREVLDSDYRGPRAVFTQVDVLKAIVAVGTAGSIGRGKLGTSTGLGQGEVRTLIKRLRDSGLITIESNGCSLSARGRREYERIASLLPWSSRVEASRLNIGSVCWAVVVAGSAGKVRFGLEQRDAAIRAGAEGAFTAVFRGGRFLVPGEGTDCEGEGPSEPWTNIRKARIQETDVVIVTGSQNASVSENGALAAFLTLM